LDKGGRSMTLRPELTAGVVRALLEHKLLAQGPQRLYYLGPFFRYERPQAGRYRQANQFGVECFGVPGPEADAEVIQIAALLLARYAIADAVLNVNTVGDKICRPVYRQALLDHFRPHAAELGADSQRRLERNPLRILDSKDPQDAPFVASAPTMIEYLCPECRAHFDALRAYLDALGIAYVVNPRIVRGLDYYTRTVFEFVSSVIGSQSTVCGGGRYDGLVEELGGPPTPGVGFGLGIERFLMVVEKLAGEHAPRRRGVQAIALGEAARARLVAIVGALREASGEPTFADWQNRKLTAHFKTADRNNARWALILGDDELASGEIVLRDLVARSDRRLPMAGPAAEVARVLVEATG
ncbi:MAG: histidine--tRNA ligase, partial [Candidatus Eremiobacteraeota bacterium]|nr:histidine--tRNA ligase [Candidatus Eremiobacteraeota bacterium]